MIHRGASFDMRGAWRMAVEQADHDIVIRGGTVIDGRGGDPFMADVELRYGRIERVGTVAGRGCEEIDAAGFIGTPGFVDVHTHFDA
jgi:N-acyl-D-amino-acid deacylase